MKTSDNHSAQNDESERQIFEAMKRLRWFVPCTPKEVADLESDFELAEVELPDEIAVPDLAWDRSTNLSLAVPGEISARSSTEDNLARAAREGAEISPEVEERMKNDREEAENSKKNR